MPANTLDLAVEWVRTAKLSRLAFVRPLGGGGSLAYVNPHPAGDGRWSWLAAGTTGDQPQRGDAERLAELRLKYASHEAWMQRACHYEWADVSTMHPIK